MPELGHSSVEADALHLLEMLCREPSVSAEGRALDTTATVVNGLGDAPSAG